MQFYKMSVDESLRETRSTIFGLSEKDVEERIFASKQMQIKPQKKVSFFIRFMTQLKDLMVLVLLVSGTISLFIGLYENTMSEIVDGAIILGIVTMNALFGALQERKSEKAIESLKKLSQPETIVLRDGVVKKIKTSELVSGDVVCLSAGSIIPADVRFLETINLSVNESMLTGESDAVFKDAKKSFNKDKPLAERSNMGYQGSVVQSGHASGVVVALGIETELGRIAHKLSQTKKEGSPLQKDIKNVGKVLTFIILLIASITFALEVVANPHEIMRSFLTAVAISVAAIPESLPAVITIIMSLGMFNLSKKRAIVRHMPSVETLGACDVICSDKTGTITQNSMKVEQIYTKFDFESEFFDVFMKNMTLCNDAKVGECGFLGSPTEIALSEFAKLKGFSKSELDKTFPRLDEKSFNSERKFMSTLHNINGRKICFAKGALDRILDRCSFIAEKNKIVPLDEKTKKEIQEHNKKMCADALRVMAFAFKYEEASQIREEKFVFLGLCGLQDPPRKEVLGAVQKCKDAGLRAIMITGDYKDTAFAIAKKVGIAASEKQVISGEEIDALSEEEFENVVKIKNVFARVSPEHKVKIVDALKKCGHVVAMTGDGVNDAPSLKKADIGIGMGKSGTDVVKNTADILITDDNFSTIVVAVEEGRKIYSNIQKTIRYLFSANMAEILALFFVTILFPGKTFLLPAQILFINLITDSLPAIALGTEKAESEIMKHKPRDAKKGLFSNGIGVSILILGFLQTFLTFSSYVCGLVMFGEKVAITMAFYTLNFIQLFYMFTARTNESIFKSNPFKNKILNLSLLAGFGLLLVIAVTKFGEVLSLTKLNFVCWAIVFLLSISIIFFGELYKLCAKNMKKKKLH